MKNLTLFLSFLLLGILSARAQNITYAKTIDILHQPEEPVIKKIKAVSVQQNGGEYTILYNVRHGKEIMTHRAVIVSDKYFDKAGYTWVSRKKVAIKLFSTKSNIKFHCKVWGNEPSSNGLEVDPEEGAKL